eukprot:Hpha_TRINITY_DN10887_c0_g4::TRINITY_DN10887_c0_g4_i1::g.23501::m.23501
MDDAVDYSRRMRGPEPPPVEIPAGWRPPQPPGRPPRDHRSTSREHRSMVFLDGSNEGSDASGSGPGQLRGRTFTMPQEALEAGLPHGEAAELAERVGLLSAERDLINSQLDVRKGELEQLALEAPTWERALQERQQQIPRLQQQLTAFVDRVRTQYEAYNDAVDSLSAQVSRCSNLRKQHSEDSWQLLVSRHAAALEVAATAEEQSPLRPYQEPSSPSSASAFSSSSASSSPPSSSLHGQQECTLHFEGASRTAGESVRFATTTQGPGLWWRLKQAGVLPRRDGESTFTVTPVGGGGSIRVWASVLLGPGGEG